MTRNPPVDPDPLAAYTVSELLSQYAAIAGELRRRAILRSANNPTGDLAEDLFATAFGWRRAANSTRAFDATDAEGLRYQIKGRRLERQTTSRQLSALRSLDGFDVLAAVLFDAHYRVIRAALIPVGVVVAKARYSAHTNSHRFMLQDRVWEEEGVEDVTAALRAVQDR